MCVDLCVDLRSLDLHQYETRQEQAVLCDLVKRINQLFERLFHLLNRVATSKEESHHSHDDSTQFRIRIDTAMREDSPESRLEFVISMSLGILRAKRAAASALTLCGDWLQKLETLASCRRCMIKTVIALENCLALLGEQAPRLDFFSEVQKGVEVRRCYGELCFEINEATHQDLPIDEKLRLVGLALGRLRKLDAYEYVRFSDRQLVANLKSRLRNWFESERNHGQGTGLLDDIRFSTELLLSINSRQELQEHDLVTVRSCLNHLEAHQACTALLHALVGRSKRLDALILSFADERSLREVLIELEQELMYQTGATTH